MEAERAADVLARCVHELVIANRILAHEGVLDAYGHVSMRHPLDPQRFLLSRSLSPELVEASDILEFDMSGSPIKDSGVTPYLERFIHSGVYAARGDVRSVVHSHAIEVLPFTVSPVKLRPVISLGSDLGAEVPVWDIRDTFGDTAMLVTRPEHGRNLAACLGARRAVLMRGHGYTACGLSIYEAVRTAIYLAKNAQVQRQAMAMGGELTFLSEGEIELRANVDPFSPQVQRAWEYWAQRAGVPVTPARRD